MSRAGAALFDAVGYCSNDSKSVTTCQASITEGFD